MGCAGGTKAQSPKVMKETIAERTNTLPAPVLEAQFQKLTRELVSTDVIEVINRQSIPEMRSPRLSADPKPFSMIEPIEQASFNPESHSMIIPPNAQQYHEEEEFQIPPDEAAKESLFLNFKQFEEEMDRGYELILERLHAQDERIEEANDKLTYIRKPRPGAYRVSREAVTVTGQRHASRVETVNASVEAKFDNHSGQAGREVAQSGGLNSSSIGVQSARQDLNTSTHTQTGPTNTSTVMTQAPPNVRSQASREEFTLQDQATETSKIAQVQTIDAQQPQRSGGVTQTHGHFPGVLRCASTQTSLLLPHDAQRSTRRAPSVQSEVSEMWDATLSDLQDRKLTQAYERVLRAGDDIYLLRLMHKTGVVLDKFPSQTRSEVLMRVCLVAKSYFAEKLGVKWISDSVRSGAYYELGEEDQGVVLETLYQLSTVPGEEGVTAAQLYSHLTVQHQIDDAFGWGLSLFMCLIPSLNPINVEPRSSSSFSSAIRKLNKAGKSEQLSYFSSFTTFRSEKFENGSVGGVKMFASSECSVT